MRSFPFTFTHIDTVVTRRTTPVDACRRFTPYEGAELPECFTYAGAATPVHAVHDRGCDLFRRDDERRKPARKIERAALMAGMSNPFIRLKQAGVHHASAEPRGKPRDDTGNRFAFGARSKGERHAMFQDGLRQGTHVVERRSEATVDQRACA